MVLYLTSSPAGMYKGGESTFEGLDPSNGLLEELKKDWKKKTRCLLICADPIQYTKNDEMGEFLEDRIVKSGLDVGTFTVCDYRNVETVMHNLSEYDFIILGGGHVPTQNEFFEFIHLRHLLNQFRGNVMGISAGSMNCAEEVYAMPELEGESCNRRYRRFMEGLGLTRRRVIPHYNVLKDEMLDGKRMLEDIACVDSVGREFYLIPDGSFILQRDGKEELHGEGYMIRNNKIKKIGEADQVNML